MIPRIFNRALYRQRRLRARACYARHDFLLREMAERLSERLDDITRRFPTALLLGARAGELEEALRGRGGIERLVVADNIPQSKSTALILDEEHLPFAPQTFDAVISLLSLHTVNDLPGALSQLRACLRPDGLLLAMVLGGETLKELREAFAVAEAESGGMSPRVAPFMDVRDGGSLLSRAGFTLPVVDSERLVVRYANAFSLMHDLRGMGEGNILHERLKRPTSRATFMRMAEVYHRLFAGEDGRIPATFELVTLTAWSPHVSQPKPLARGSGAVNLGKILGE